MRSVRLLSLASCGVFSLQFVALHGLGPDGRDISLEQLAGCVGCVALGALAWTLASSLGARVFFATVFGLAFAAQALALRQFGAGLDTHFVESAQAAWVDVKPSAMPLLPTLLGAGLFACFVEGFVLSVGRSPAPRKASFALAGVALAGLWFGPAPDHATPEIRLAFGLRRLFQSRAAAPYGVVDLSPIRSAKGELPSVLFVLTESIRASDYCAAPRASCDVAPEVNALLPGRIALSELRSIASYTAISVAALSTGNTQLGTREQIALAPTFFDYLRALEGSPVRTACFSAHDKEGLWERANIEDSIGTFVMFEHLDDKPGSRDRVLVDAFEAYIRAEAGPVFAMLHFYGTHAPYYAAEDSSPLQPTTQAASWDTLAPLHNQYKNAILTQDRQLARGLRAFIETRTGPWVILFTSDHGEAFGEHHAIHHGQSLFDEQIHVPGFVAFGGGALSAREAATLAERAAGPTLHLDFLPTVLDLYGIWDSLSVFHRRISMLGSSLLRSAPAAPRAIPMTNCTASTPCPLNTWGMLGDHHALVGQVWDSDFSCVPLDDSGRVMGDAPECTALRTTSKTYFQKLPNRKPNR